MIEVSRLRWELNQMYLRKLIAPLGALSPDTELLRVPRLPQKNLRLEVHWRILVMIVKEHLL
uniref:Uncharacterized protein n=1 Tax=Arundo donax TaxID=35708 RepID=A0A0A9H7U3_ARUDO